MKNSTKLNIKGFTLVELLVVVLIIGILASIALPAYQKSVEQSRAAQVWPLLKSVTDASKIYYMSRGAYPTTFDSLDILAPSWSGAEKWSTLTNISDTRSNGEWSLQLYKTEGTGAFQVYAGRLKGKYRGAGFVITAIPGNGSESDVMRCVERRQSGIVFEEEAGAYCEEIFDGVDMNTDGTYRAYSLP